MFNTPMMLPAAKRDPFFANVRVLYRFDETVAGAKVFAQTGSLADAGTAVGDAKLVLGTKKFGDGSVYFDGTGDYIRQTGTNNTAIGTFTQNYCVEAWVNRDNNAAADQTIFDMRENSSGWGVFARVTSGNLQVFAYTAQRWAVALAPLTWHHVAVVGVAGNHYLYLNGVQVGSAYADARIQANSLFTIGAPIDFRATNNTAKLRGYIDSFRLTTGVSRYTGPFTPAEYMFPKK